MVTPRFHGPSWIVWIMAIRFMATATQGQVPFSCESTTIHCINSSIPHLGSHPDTFCLHSQLFQIVSSTAGTPKTNLTVPRAVSELVQMNKHVQKTWRTPNPEDPDFGWNIWKQSKLLLGGIWSKWMTPCCKRCRQVRWSFQKLHATLPREHLQASHSWNSSRECLARWTLRAYNQSELRCHSGAVSSWHLFKGKS